MSDPVRETPHCCQTCQRDTECALCMLLAYGDDVFVDFRPTAEQVAAMEAFMAARTGETDGPLYQAMMATGLPAWGQETPA